MLPIPNLDDRYFDQLVKDARKTIPKLLPEWTDENAHDPGITMIELLSWMTEMQMYYLNRITERHERKYLKLLGVRPRDAEQAVADVAFSGAEEPVVLPRGTRLVAMDQPFETTETVVLLPVKLEKLIVRTEEAASDYTSTNAHTGISYYAFGPDARSGSRLYIGFDRPLPEQTDITLAIKQFEDYPVPVGSGIERRGTERVASVKVSWKYYGEDDSEGWLPVELLRDTTAHLSQSGRIGFRIAAPMKPLTVHPAADRRRYWLCCTLEEDGYELAPRIERISLNTVHAAQRETFGAAVEWDSDGEAEQSFEMIAHWAYYGMNLVQVRDDRGDWRDWREVADFAGCKADDACYTLRKDLQRKTVRIAFGDGSAGAIPPEGKQRIRLVYYAPTFEAARRLGRSNGLPNQSVELGSSRLVRDRFLLQVGRLQSGTNEFVWEDWTMVDDFDNSGSYDRHYVYDAESGTIRFGDNEAGIVPHACEADNLRIVALQTGGGIRGNVAAGLIAGIVADDPALRGLAVTNPFPAAGGAEPETVEEAKLRVHRELREPQRAVTSDDYEAIARRTPGLRVARVKAIPLYAPGLRDYPHAKAPAQVTVAVVPYSESPQPKASPGFLETVRRHLDRHRLLTTHIHVIPAVYIKITVHAVVVVEPHLKDEARLVADELDRLLTPLDRADGATGWTFGRTVYKGDIYGAINRVRGVSYVQDLWIDMEGHGARKDSGGDVQIPPYGLVCSGEHEIELVSRNDV